MGLSKQAGNSNNPSFNEKIFSYFNHDDIYYRKEDVPVGCRRVPVALEVILPHETLPILSEPHKFVWVSVRA